MKIALFVLIFSSTKENVIFSQDQFKLIPKTFERHTELSWVYNNVKATSFRVKKSILANPFTTIATINSKHYFHFTDAAILEQYDISVEALDVSGKTIALSDTIHISEQSMTDEDLLDMVQEQSFRYFWEFGHPTSGMARERNTSGDVVTTGGTGFGIMSMLVAIENGYITREEGVNRVLKILGFLQIADKFHGVFPHWMNGQNGDVFPFSQFDNGGDLVETAFLIQGLLTARQFFDADNNSEKTIRQIITKIWEAVEWDFYSKNNSGSLLWHWSPQHEWKINHIIRGYNEALIVYLLAIASPTHAVSVNYWKNGWAGGNYKNGLNYYGIKLPLGPAYGGPLFFSHYSYLGFDPRNIKDQYANYFIQNVNHSLINHAYCASNPLKHKEYSAQCWGITASDDPGGYLAHEPVNRDNGTISPTAALSSMPYTPKESLDALKYFYFSKGDKLFGQYGFYDAFNPSKNWYASSFLAIDQGPIICMIQNYRTGLLWRNFMKNNEIKPALDKIGFVEDVSSLQEHSKEFSDFFQLQSVSQHEFELINSKSLAFDFQLLDKNGRLIMNKINVKSNFTFGHDLLGGIYFIFITVGKLTFHSTIAKI